MTADTREAQEWQDKWVSSLLMAYQRVEGHFIVIKLYM